jgi:transposase
VQEELKLHNFADIEYLANIFYRNAYSVFTGRERLFMMKPGVVRVTSRIIDANFRRQRRFPNGFDK